MIVSCWFYHHMQIIDILVGLFLAYAIYKGVRNGFIIELSSLVSLMLGILIAIKFSHYLGDYLGEKTSWNPEYVKIISFVLTFILVLMGVMLLGKALTKMIGLMMLGWLNRLAGGIFSLLKMMLILSVCFNFFDKWNDKGEIVSHEKLEASHSYRPIKVVSQMIYPSIELWFGRLVTEMDERTREI